MRNIRRDAQIWLQLVTFVVIWGGILYLTGTNLGINVEAVKKLPEVVTIYTVLYLGFAKWGWRWKGFQGWLVPFPNLQGTWEGTAETTWKDPATGTVPPPIPVRLVIRQTFTSISCVMYSEESVSQSNATMISEDEESGMKRLSYNYTNIPRVTVRDRSAIHDGAVILRIIKGQERSLEGEYWTNRKSTGEIRVTFKSKELLETFKQG